MYNWSVSIAKKSQANTIYYFGTCIAHRCTGHDISKDWQSSRLKSTCNEIWVNPCKKLQFWWEIVKFDKGVYEKEA